jgi:hypothetical protein
MAAYPVEEPTVYGTLFEQADPWDTIGQILGLPDTKPSKSPGEEINELDWSEASFETSSEVVETEEREEDFDYPLRQEIVSSRCDSQRQDAGTPQTCEEDEDEQLFVANECESVLAIPELEELDGLFIGPSLFELDKDEDEK